MNLLTRSANGDFLGARIGQPNQPLAAYWGRRFVIFILLTWTASLLIGFQSALVILVGLGFGAAIIGLRYPTIGVLGTSLLCTLDSPARVYVMTGGLLRWNTFNYWLLIVMALSITFLLRLSDPQTRFLQLFMLLLSLELIVSPDKTRGVLHMLNIIVLFGLLIYFARAAEDDHIWYWLGLANGVLAGLGGLVYFLQRSRLEYINPNAWGFFPLTALFALCLALPFAASERNGQLTVLLLSVVNIGWLFLSGSRGNLLIGFVCLLFEVVTMRGLPSRMSFLGAIVLLGIAISTQFTDLQARTLQRIDHLLNPNYSATSRTSGRSDLVLGGLDIFLDHPIGVGTGGFAYTWAGLAWSEERSGFEHGEEFESHSAWIKTLAENGVPGFVLLATYVLSFVASGLRRRNRDMFALGLLVVLVFSAAWVSTEFQGKGLWFLAAGVTTIFHREQIIAHLQGAARREPITNIVRPERPARG